MGIKPMRFTAAPATWLVVGAFLLVGIPVRAQSTSAQTNSTTSAQTSAQANAGAQDNRGTPNDDITRRDVAKFDQFLDTHPTLAAELRQNPSLINDQNYVNSSAALRDYLRDNPGVRDEIRQNPNGFMQAEQRFDNHENDRDRGGDRDRDAMVRFDHFLDSHPEIGEQVKKNPSLVDDRTFVQNHPALQDYLRDNPQVRDELRQNPSAFLQQPPRPNNGGDYDQGRNGGDNDRTRNAGDYDNRGDNGRDRDARTLADFTRFMDSHREVAEQVRRDPSLLDNRDFVQNHPDLQDYLRNNPEVRDQIRQDPNAFVQREEQFNRQENVQDRDNRRDLAQFNRFLDGHREIAEQVRRDPSLLDKRDFVQSHPALQDYLRDNPSVRDEIRQDPNAFMHQEDRFNAGEHWDNRDAASRHMASFGEFLGSHQDIRSDVTKDPSVVKDREYVQNHPELDGYLNAHPDVRSDMMADPDHFVRGAQQMSTTGKVGAGASMNGSGSGTSVGTSTGAAADTSTHGSSATGTSTGTSNSTTSPKPKK